MASDKAYFLANLLLIAYPLLITYYYVEEKPPRDHLLVYWAVYSLLSLLDRVLELIPGYYVIKMLLLLLLFLEPYHFVVLLKQKLHELKKVPK